MWSKAQRIGPNTGLVPARWRPDHANGVVHEHVPAAPPVLHLTDVALGHTAGEAPSLDEQLAAAYAQGAEDTRVLVEQAMLDERRRLQQTIVEIAGLRRHVLEDAERDLMQLAVGMARRVLHRDVHLDPDVLLAMAHVAVARLGDRIVATVHLNPGDLAAMHQADKVRDGITLVADAEVAPGGCRLTSEHGEIDLGIDAQVNELARGLLSERTEGRGRVSCH